MKRIEQTAFGANGAKLYRLRNSHGLEVTVTDFGARIVQIVVPVTGEIPRNISPYGTSAEQYLEQDFYVGSSVVPVIGRISGAKTEIKGVTYQFTENEPGKTLHSGVDTANCHLWQTEVDEAENAVRFHYELPDGKNGFPGNVSVTATFQVTEENGLVVRYEAVSDKDTIFNPTSHVYFNLTGDFEQPVDKHHLTLAASRFAELDHNNLPTGQLLDVSETPFDFRQGALFEQGFASLHSQIALVNGYDHPWVLDESETPVTVVSPDEKVRVSVRTNQPSVVIYTYNHGPTDFAAQHGIFSLECQELPDACNQENFGSILLEAGEQYLSETTYQIAWK